MPNPIFFLIDSVVLGLRWLSDNFIQFFVLILITLVWLLPQFLIYKAYTENNRIFFPESMLWGADAFYAFLAVNLIFWSCSRRPILEEHRYSRPEYRSPAHHVMFGLGISGVMLVLTIVALGIVF